MKYETTIETDEFEDFEFYEDGNGKYIHGIDAGSVNGEWIALYFTECKQEIILDKIRAEVIEKAKCTMNDTRAEGLYMALQIIDKYRGD